MKLPAHLTSTAFSQKVEIGDMAFRTDVAQAIESRIYAESNRVCLAMWLAGLPFLAWCVRP
jgi:hypothetical protein